MVDENALNIYTDGSSLAGPRRGGSGIRFIFIDQTGNEVVEEFAGLGLKGANSVEMELSACIQALRRATPFLKRLHFRKIIVFTDLQFIVDNYHNAIYRWPKTKWRKRDGGPVINAVLWKDLVKGIKKTGAFVEFRKVKGHSKDQHNKAVDILARESARNPLNRTLPGITVRRKISSERTRIGSVGFLGQKVRIRIIESKYLTVQKTTRYRFEVMSKNSKYYGKVDFLFTNDPLRPGHLYSVRLNKDPGNPGLLKNFGEISSQKKGGTAGHRLETRHD